LLDEALAMNANAAVFAFQFQNLTQEDAACALSLDRPNLSVYAADGAVISGVAGKWRPGDPPTGTRSARGGAPVANYSSLVILQASAVLCAVSFARPCEAERDRWSRGWSHKCGFSMRGSDPTYLGRVSAVSGASITVKFAESLASGLAIIDGHTYRVGQVGSFVRIPLGYQDLFGVVAEVGATAAPPTAPVQEIESGRWMRVELAGEAIGDRFERGLSQHPSIDDTVHIVTERDLRRIYGGAEDDQIKIGTLSSAENITIRLSLDALVTRHSAILGSTGWGKSTTIASLLRSIVEPIDGSASSGARILLLDLHGEYSAALGDVAKIFSATPQPGEEALFVPFGHLKLVSYLTLSRVSWVTITRLPSLIKFTNWRSSELLMVHYQASIRSLWLSIAPSHFPLSNFGTSSLTSRRRLLSDRSETNRR
jgi:hypothetical protein